MRLTAAAVVVGVVGVVTGVTGVSGAAPATAAIPPACADFQPDLAVEPYAGSSAPLRLLGIEKAQKVFDGAREPGAGVSVAVLDSGVGRGGGMDVVAGRNVTGLDELVAWHGTAVRRIIAGAPLAGGSSVGIAPGARIVDVRVYDSGDPQPGQGEQGVTPESVAAGLDWVARVARDRGIGVANVSLGVSGTPELRAAVRRAWRAGVVVVASTGNRPEEGGFLYSELGGEVRRPGEDAAGLVFPAGYRHVVGVNATRTGEPSGTPVTGFVLPSSDTDVAAPTYGVLSVAVNANGTTTTPTRLTGVGVVQPYQALTRPVDPRPDGAVEVSTVEHAEVRAVAPERPEDLLADTRRDAVWWGLVGGGVLVVALLLRPVLARRRSPRIAGS